jgi:hypothetical protein
MDAIRQEVGEYVKEQAAISLSKSITDVSRGSRHLKFTPTFRLNCPGFLGGWLV